MWKKGEGAPRWTDAEMHYLRANYSKGTLRDHAKMLPGRTPWAIGARARRIGLSSGRRRFKPESTPVKKQVFATKTSPPKRRTYDTTPCSVRELGYVS